MIKNMIAFAICMWIGLVGVIVVEAQKPRKTKSSGSIVMSSGTGTISMSSDAGNWVNVPDNGIQWSTSTLSSIHDFPFPTGKTGQVLQWDNDRQQWRWATDSDVLAVGTGGTGNSFSSAVTPSNGYIYYSSTGTVESSADNNPGRATIDGIDYIWSDKADKWVEVKKEGK